MTAHSNSIAVHLSRFDDGPDVTAQLGSQKKRAEDAAFEEAREAFAVATGHPSIENFRSAVVAYDDLVALVKSEVKL